MIIVNYFFLVIYFFLIISIIIIYTHYYRSIFKKKYMQNIYFVKRKMSRLVAVRAYVIKLFNSQYFIDDIKGQIDVYTTPSCKRNNIGKKHLKPFPR